MENSGFICEKFISTVRLILNQTSSSLYYAPSATVVSLKTTKSLSALPPSKPPNKIKCGPIVVHVCRYRLAGGMPVYGHWDHVISVVLRFIKKSPEFSSLGLAAASSSVCLEKCSYDSDEKGFFS